MNFSNKERTLLEDQKNHEKICIQKYANYASLASCQELKGIFTQNGQIEQEHYNTIDQLLKGQMPQMQQSSGGQNSSSQIGSSQMASKLQSSSQGGSQQSGSQQSGSQNQMQSMQSQSSFMPQGQSSGFNTSDKDLCTDMLMTEKYVSGAYNTAIFEFRDPQVRNILNHIQKEEQQHGEAIFKYMESKGMYQAK